FCRSQTESVMPPLTTLTAATRVPSLENAMEETLRSRGRLSEKGGGLLSSGVGGVPGLCISQSRRFSLLALTKRARSWEYAESSVISTDTLSRLKSFGGADTETTGLEVPRSQILRPISEAAAKRPPSGE